MKRCDLLNCITADDFEWPSSVFLFFVCVLFFMFKSFFSNVLVNSFITFSIRFYFFLHYHHLLLTTVTFTNLFLACTFVAAFNKLYRIVLYCILKPTHVTTTESSGVTEHMLLICITEQMPCYRVGITVARHRSLPSLTSYKSLWDATDHTRVRHCANVAVPP